MKTTLDRFDERGFIRDFDVRLYAEERKTHFNLQIGARLVACSLAERLDFAPAEGQCVRVLGAWTSHTGGGTVAVETLIPLDAGPQHRLSGIQGTSPF